MHSVDLLEEATTAAMDAGFEVRQEWLNETLGGVCRIGSRRILFVNLGLSAQEQLECVCLALAEAFAENTSLQTRLALSPELQQRLNAMPVLDD